MALANNYNVFLETLNRGSEQRTNVLAPGTKSGGVSLNLSEDMLRPVLANLAKQTAPMEIGQLATVANVKLTLLVLALQQLTQAGLVDYNQATDFVALTDVGRQVLNVGKML